jgi:hypothetical protein
VSVIRGGKDSYQDCNCCNCLGKKGGRGHTSASLFHRSATWQGFLFDFVFASLREMVNRAKCLHQVLRGATLELLREMFGEHSVCRTAVGRGSAEGDKRWQLPSTSKTTANDEKIRELHEFVPNNNTVNSDFYCDVLRRLRENVQRKRLEIWINYKHTFITLTRPPTRPWKQQTAWVISLCFEIDNENRSVCQPKEIASGTRQHQGMPKVPCPLYKTPRRKEWKGRTSAVGSR